jgi:hypothetical protein
MIEFYKDASPAGWRRRARWTDTKNSSGSPRLTPIKSSAVLTSPAKITPKPMFLEI